MLTSHQWHCCVRLCAIFVSSQILLAPILAPPPGKRIGDIVPMAPPATLPQGGATLPLDSPPLTLALRSKEVTTTPQQMTTLGL